MARSANDPSAALADRYGIERELGRGGNAVVYLAHDVKHERKVALKVLLPELALAVRAERFLREIQIAAKLTHPHILGLFDSGEVDGMPYYVMPYVEGESLRDRVQREKQLSVEDALRITRDVAEALSYAHAQGVVHRDIKPENVLLSAGGAIVADFGIARALTVAGGQTVTESGVAVGTPAYMSPEQGAGSGEVDARSDLYSLGCVLYEMLAGHPPFTGGTAQEILARHALDTVPTLRAARPDVPAPLEQAITKALSKSPAARFPSVAMFAEELSRSTEQVSARRPRALAVTGVGVALAALAMLWVARARLTTENVRSLAVMPCDNLTTDPDNVSFSQGMAEELISDLGRIDGLIVPALTSSVEAHKKDASPRGVARLLDVSNVLECTVRRAGGRIRMTAHLVRAADERQLWSDVYDRELTGMSDVITMQENIAQAIVTALQLRLAAGGAPLARRSTQNLAAHDLYLQGRDAWIQRTPTSRVRARELFKQAISLDSGYALAYAGLADVYWLVSGYPIDKNQDSLRALERAAALMAVKLAPGLAEGHAALGAVRNREGDQAGAEREFQRAINLNPGYAWAHALYALYLSNQGRFDDGLREAREAQRLDPFSGSIFPATAMYRARSYDEAIAAARKAIDVAPGYEGGYNTLGLAYVAKRMYREGIAELERAESIGIGPTSEKRGRLGYAYARGGRRADALNLLPELERNASRGDAGPSEIMAVVMVQLGLGQNEEAIRTLQTPLPPGQYFNPTIMGGPLFDPIQSDARYQEVLKRNGRTK